MERFTTMGNNGEVADLLTVQKVINESLDQRLATYHEQVMQSIGQVVGRVTELERRQDIVEKTVEQMDEAVRTEFQAVREEIKEQKNRIIRMTNAVMMGVEESSEGLNLAQDLLNIIAPGVIPKVVDTRVGHPEAKKPRPLRVHFPSSQARDAALASCAKLKDDKRFQGISVRKDLTKSQQQEYKVKAVVRNNDRKTRSSVKRKQDENGQEQSDPKASRMEQS